MENVSQPTWAARRIKRLVGALITLSILAFSFYWFEYRPMVIRQDCAFDAGKRAFFKEVPETQGADLLRVQNELFNTYYLYCVRSGGIAE